MMRCMDKTGIRYWDRFSLD